MRRARDRKASRTRRTRRQASSTAAQPPAEETPPVVAIGASAGGLEAIEQFLGAVPDSSGLAFVIVQHLDPTHQGIMPELLQRRTSMHVEQVKDRTRVEPEHVYVIPPNRDLSSAGTPSPRTGSARVRPGSRPIYPSLRTSTQ